MYDLFISLFWPLIFLFDSYYDFLLRQTNSEFIAIIILSVSSSILMIPFYRLGLKEETKINKVIAEVNDKVLKLPNNLKGEDRFIKIEKIYNLYNYHPIHNLRTGASFFFILPFLLSAYFFFSYSLASTGYTYFDNEFLSKPDSLFWDINIFPVLILIINILDLLIFNSNRATEAINRYLFLSFFIFILIYKMPACLTIFWLINTLFSMIISRVTNQ